MTAAAAAPGAEWKHETTAADGEDPRWRPVMTLPCQLTVDLAMPGFAVSDFLRLRVGSVVGTRWALARNVPLRVNGTVIGWGELETAGKHLAVRLTELA